MLLIVLFCIALFVKDRFIKPFIGDVFIVIWMYLFLTSFINVNRYYLTHAVLLFAFSVETTQYFKLVDRLGLQDIAIARIVIGSTFDWMDYLAYIVGWGIVLILETPTLRHHALDVNAPLNTGLYITCVMVHSHITSRACGIYRFSGV